MTNGIFGFLVVDSNYRKNGVAGMYWTNQWIAVGKSGAGVPHAMTLTRGGGGFGWGPGGFGRARAGAGSKNWRDEYVAKRVINLTGAGTRP
jgi:hypothetical protein